MEKLKAILNIVDLEYTKQMTCKMHALNTKEMMDIVLFLKIVELK